MEVGRKLATSYDRLGRQQVSDVTEESYGEMDPRPSYDNQSTLYFAPLSGNITLEFDRQVCTVRPKVFNGGFSRYHGITACKL